MPTPREEIRIVAKRLQPLKVPYAFVGGAVMCLLVDNHQVFQFRPTKDVDVVVAITSYQDLVHLENLLRSNGFQNDTSQGAPICRWIVDGCRVDIMPTEPSNLGMNTRWFPEVLNLSVAVDLGDGDSATIVSRPLFLATKLEAFKDRGKGDYYMSHDLEDIITLVDGCSSIAEEVNVCEKAVKLYISQSFKQILSHPDFPEALRGHLQESLRAALVFDRLKAIADLT